MLGLATGSSPIGTYEQLIEWYKKEIWISLKCPALIWTNTKVSIPENDQSYRYFMNTHFFDHVNIDKANTSVPDGLEPDSDKACRKYDEIIEKSGGVDLQLLGLGHNGHIGFNEPCDIFPSGTHCVDLAPSTIEANKRFFASETDVPRQAYTMGIRSIMLAKKDCRSSKR